MTSDGCLSLDAIVHIYYTCILQYMYNNIMLSTERSIHYHRTIQSVSINLVHLFLTLSRRLLLLNISHVDRGVGGASTK